MLYLTVNCLSRVPFDDIMATTTSLLGRDYAMVMDCELRDVALSGTNIVYAGGKASRDKITASDKMTVSTIKDDYRSACYKQCT